MEVVAISNEPATSPADAIVVGLWADGSLSPSGRRVDEATGGVLAGLIERKESSGKLYECTTLHAPAGVKANIVLVAGLGDPAKFDGGAAFRAAAAAVRQLSSKLRKRISLYLAEGIAAGHAAEIVAGAIVGCQGADLYRKEKKRFPVEVLELAGTDEAALTRGRIIGDAVNRARRLVNEPADTIYPESFVSAAVAAAGESGVSVEVWDEKRLSAERCGSLLAVAKGSQRPARLVILEYRGGKPDDAPLAIVGKGVTFDSGGLSLKPTDSMTTMKCDMAGAAATLAAVCAAARLKLPVNVVGFCGLVENMTGGGAMKLGDVLTARSGKTIEVLNTDAEGRLVLADVLNVALDRKPARIVDMATLTGACVVALGTDVVGAFTNDQSWCDTITAAARKVGEPIWQMPMYPEYSEHIKSEIADIKNTGDGRWGGAITAAKFLEEFVDGKPWCHLDIAGPAYFDKPKPWADVGGTGVMVRTLIELMSG